jgi:hypothetical protein
MFKSSVKREYACPIITPGYDKVSIRFPSPQAKRDEQYGLMSVTSAVKIADLSKLVVKKADEA